MCHGTNEDQQCRHGTVPWSDLELDIPREPRCPIAVAPLPSARGAFVLAEYSNCGIPSALLLFLEIMDIERPHSVNLDNGCPLRKGIMLRLAR